MCLSLTFQHKFLKHSQVVTQRWEREPKSGVLGSFAAFLSSKECQHLLIILSPWLNRYVIPPPNKAGNMGTHSMVSRKEEVLSLGAKSSFV